MPSLSLPAPAKINRFLHITGQREDGYHDLQTIFQFLDLCDTLHFQREKSRKIHLNSSLPGSSEQHNLVFRAALALQEATSCNQGVEIHLEKQIPLGAGLGGGSSDAASTLLALNQLWETQLTKTQLMAIGLKLGADVPIFIHGHSAWAEGIGEQLRDIELPEGWILLIAPPVQISSAEIFFDRALSRNTPRCRMSASLIETGHNDCEQVVRDRYPEVAKALDCLNHFVPARMTGTGACIFAPVSSEQQGREILQEMPAEYRGFVVRSLNRSPIIDLLD